MKFEKYFTWAELQGMHGEKSKITKDQKRRLNEMQDSLIDQSHVSKVNRFIKMAEKAAEGFDGDEYNRVYLAEMNRLTIEAGLRVKWVPAPAEEVRVIDIKGRDADYNNARRKSLGLEVEA